MKLLHQTAIFLTLVGNLLNFVKIIAQIFLTRAKIYSLGMDLNYQTFFTITAHSVTVLA